MNDRPPQAPLPPAMALAIGLLAVSTSSVFIRYAQEYAPSLVIAAYRLSIATLVLAPYALRHNIADIRHLSLRDLGLAGLAGFFLALHFVTWVTSLEFTTVASSVVLVTTSPLWVALLAPIALQEPLTRPVVVGLGVALLGGMLIGLSDACTLAERGFSCPALADLTDERALLGDLLALGGALTGAGYLLIGRKLRASLTLIPYIFLVYGIAALVLDALVLGMGLPPFDYPAPAFLWFVLLALVPQILGHSTFNWALRYLPAALVSLTLLGEPIGASLLAYLLLGETPTSVKIFGAILIFVGLYLASQNKSPAISRRKPQKI